jgi:hypothetical protein
LYLQMECLFALCLCGVPVCASRGDCSPSGWILVRLVGCISVDISQEWQLELAAVGATLALRLISVLVYLYAA